MSKHVAATLMGWARRAMPLLAASVSAVSMAGGCSDDAASDGGGAHGANGGNGGTGGPSVPGTLGVWTEHVAHKVQPTTTPGSATSASLEGLRRSVESFQLVVHASGGFLSDVDVTAGDLDDGAGHVIPAARMSLFREVFIDFTGVQETEPGSAPAPASSPTADALVPDPLVPLVDPYSGAPAGAPFAVGADRNQPLWVDIDIPEEAVAGSYAGTLHVTAAGQSAIDVPVSLTVLDIVLPDASSVPTHFATHFESLIQYHRDTSACSGSSCWIDLNAPQAQLVGQRYEQLGHSHRIDPGELFATDAPASASQCAVPSDWSSYDASLAPYLDGSHWSDGVPSTWFPTPFSPGVSWGLEAECSEAEYTALGAAWAAHLRAQGWLDRALVYAYDEPPPEALPGIALNSQWLQNGDPGWKPRIMDTTAPTPVSAGELNPALGIYCVCLRCYDHWYQGQSEYGRAEWPDLFAQGIQLWFYESNAQSDPYPTFATNTLFGLEPRIVMWGSWFEHATGFLLWDTTAWTEDNPWGPNVGWGKSGDGVLMYPGNHDGLMTPAGSPSDVALDGPIPSYRLKVIRAGLQDWALFQLADGLGLGDVVREQVGRVYGQFGGCEWDGCPAPVNGQFFWLADPAELDAARHEVALAVLAAQ